MRFLRAFFPEVKEITSGVVTPAFVLHNTGNRLFYLLLITCLISVPLTTIAEPDYHYKDITGYVIDGQSGEAFPNASIVLKGQGASAKSNIDGYFLLPHAPADICSLYISCPGFFDQEIFYDNRYGRTNNLVVQLKHQILTDEDVSYYSSQNFEIWDTDINQVSIASKQITQLPQLGKKDTFRSLQLLPGFSSSSDRSSGLFVQGGTADQNLILFDGMKIYNSSHLFGMLSAINKNAVKNMQIYKSGYPAIYGGSLSSVVDISGKSGSTIDPGYSFGIDLLCASLYAEFPINENGSMLVSFRRSHVDKIPNIYFNELYDKVTGYDAPSSTINTGGIRFGDMLDEEIRPVYSFYDLNAKVFYAIDPKTHITFSFYNGLDKLDNTQEYTGFRVKGMEQDVNGLHTQNEVSDWGNLGGSFKWSRQWSPKIYSSLLFSSSIYSSNFERNSGFVQQFDADSISIVSGSGYFASEEENKLIDATIKLDNTWQYNRKHTIRFGSEYSFIKSDYQASYNDTIKTLEIDEPSVLLTIYLEDKWRVVNPLDFTLGLRTSYYDQTDETYYEPRLAAEFHINRHISVNGAWGLYNQFVHQVINDNVLEGSKDFWLVADENILPSQAEHQTVGISYENEYLQFDVQAYRKLNSNLIEFSRRFESKADYNSLFYFGDGISKGIDFLLKTRAGAFTGWVAYTLGKVEYDFPTMSENPFPASQDHRHDLKIAGNYVYGPWNFAAAWIFASGTAYTVPESQYSIEMLNGEIYSYIHFGQINSARLPDYHRLDLSVSRVIESSQGHIAEIGLSIFNAYNHKNVAYRQYDLTSVPVKTNDVLSMGFLPSLFFKFTY